MDIKENPVKHMDVVAADRCRPSDLAYDTMLWLCCCKAGMGHDNIQQIILENGPPALDAVKSWNIPTKARSSIRICHQSPSTSNYTVLSFSAANTQIPISIYCILGSALLGNAQTVDLGSASAFGALAPAGVTNTGLTVVSGSVGTTGSSVTGFPPGVYTGTLEVGTDAATTADADYATAYAQGQALTPTVDEAGLTTLAGLTLVPGVYNFDAAVTLDGILTLSGSGTYVFQLATTLTTIAGSSVVLTNGASACDVYWIVGTAATIGTNTIFAGNILTSTAITVTTGASVQGGLYAGSAVTLDTNAITACDSSPPVVSSSSSTSVISSTSSTLSSSSSIVPVTSTSSTKTTSTTTSKATTLTTLKTSTTKYTTSTTKKATTTTSSVKPTATSKCPDIKVDPIGYAICVLLGGLL